MIRVYQTVLGEKGNCLSACLASIFEISISEVPNFFDLYDGDDPALWWKNVEDWLLTKGYGLLHFENTDGYITKNYPGYFICVGKSGKNINHATVWKDGIMVHDPHPHECVIDKPEFVDLLYPIDPSKFQYKP